MILGTNDKAEFIVYFENGKLIIGQEKSEPVELSLGLADLEYMRFIWLSDRSKATVTIRMMNGKFHFLAAEAARKLLEFVETYTNRMLVIRCVTTEYPFPAMLCGTEFVMCLATSEKLEIVTMEMTRGAIAA